VRKGDYLNTFVVPKVMKNPEALTFWILKGLFRPVARRIYFAYRVLIPTRFIDAASGIRNVEINQIFMYDTYSRVPLVLGAWSGVVVKVLRY
jgi:hypothetical protein